MNGTCCAVWALSLGVSSHGLGVKKMAGKQKSSCMEVNFMIITSAFALLFNEAKRIGISPREYLRLALSWREVFESQRGVENGAR